jgi:hypothetical protein
MKKIVLLLSIISSFAAFGQSDMAFKFGVELDGKFKKLDPGSSYNSPTVVPYVGVFAELRFSSHFSGKLRAGLNNTYYRRDGHDYTDPVTGDIRTIPDEKRVQQTLGVSIEPRFYLFSMAQYRKINFYAALPVTFETAPISWNGNNTAMVRSELMILPSLGCRYDFNKHWGIEASGGLGLGRYFDKPQITPIRNQEMTYGLSAGLWYTF